MYLTRHATPKLLKYYLKMKKNASNVRVDGGISHNLLFSWNKLKEILRYSVEDISVESAVIATAQ